MIAILARAERNGFKPITVGKKKPKNCEPKILFEGRTKKDDGEVKTVDSNCDGKADITLFKADNTKLGTRVLLDRDYNGKTDVVIYDNNRDGKWDVSYYDTDGDGKADLIGRHPDGKINASSYEKYKKS